MAKSKKTLPADIEPTAQADGGGTTPAPEPRKGRADDIARRAYERYEMRGGGHGSDQEDWFEAERSILDDDVEGDDDLRR